VRAAVLLACAIAAVAGLGACGSRCRDVADARQALVARGPAAIPPHVEVRVPFARANTLLAEVIAAKPIVMPLELPALAALPPPVHELTAVAREVRLVPAASDRARFALRVELDDVDRPVTTLAIEVEVKPELGSGELTFSFGPENLVAVRPVLDADARRALGDAVARWLPRLPRVAIDPIVVALTEQLTGAAYEVLQKTLLLRLGELTRVRLRLPDAPIAAVVLTSSADALTIDLAIALPVRHGLPVAAPKGDDIAVRVSGSAAAELANWAIDSGRLPRSYTRDLKPKADGEFRPVFDYVAEDHARPFKIHIFQERGGCSHFQIGMRVQTRVVGDRLEIAMLDRYVERSDVGPVVSAGLWVKQLVEGSIDEVKREAARVELTIGGRTFETRVVNAEVTGDELRFDLAVTASSS
jgi:hypothetical protein